MYALKKLLQYKFIDIGDYEFTVFQILLFIAILFVARFVLLLIKIFLRKQRKRFKIDRAREHALYQILTYVCWIFAIIIALNSIGIQITLLLAGSAALLVGVGLGLQQTFNDLVSGIILLFEGTIKVDDVVEVSNIVGRVKYIGLRTSKIVTRDNIIMIIPNSKLVTDMVVNWSHIEEKTRFKVKVGVAYGSDVALVKQILLDSIYENKQIAKLPEAFVRFVDFGESSLDFELHFWTSEIFGVEDIKSDLRFMINRKFKENKVHIPFPQRDLHLVSSSIQIK